jgi:hypothetical protein
VEVLRVNGSDRPGHRRFVKVLLASLVFGLIAAPAARSSRAEAAEGGTATAAQVAAGLKLIGDIAADAAKAAQRDKEKATQIADGIEDVWKNIEDTVRGNDKDAYIAFEDAFEGLGTAAKAGDAAKATKASDTVAAAVKAYLAKYPAPAPAAPAPASAASPAPPPAARAAEAAPSPAVGPAPDPKPAAAAAAPTTAAAPDAALARTGAASGALTALAGLVFALGGLALLAGARRLSPTA